mmetsp:Transcript_63858/g.187337  ORF Transcript_63858/g.187337 Transcript_63858/m.187337 type:complete len:331 (-) Transcript_63858:52-1044(-)
MVSLVSLSQDLEAFSASLRAMPPAFSADFASESAAEAAFSAPSADASADSAAPTAAARSALPGAPAASSASMAATAAWHCSSNFSRVMASKGPRSAGSFLTAFGRISSIEASKENSFPIAASFFSETLSSLEAPAARTFRGARSCDTASTNLAFLASAVSSTASPALCTFFASEVTALAALSALLASSSADFFAAVSATSPSSWAETCTTAASRACLSAAELSTLSLQAVVVEESALSAAMSASPIMSAISAWYGWRSSFGWERQLAVMELSMSLVLFGRTPCATRALAMAAHFWPASAFCFFLEPPCTEEAGRFWGAMLRKRGALEARP